jgi:hypothetical protein
VVSCLVLWTWFNGFIVLGALLRILGCVATLARNGLSYLSFCCRFCNRLLVRVSVLCLRSITFAIFFNLDLGSVDLSLVWCSQTHAYHIYFKFDFAVVRGFTRLCLQCVCYLFYYPLGLAFSPLCCRLIVCIPIRPDSYTFVWFDWSDLYPPVICTFLIFIFLYIRCCRRFAFCTPFA